MRKALHCRVGALLLVLLLGMIGCGLRSGVTLQLRNGKKTIIIDGLKRTYILHAPPKEMLDKPLPLLVVLHGSYGTGRKMQVGLGFDEYADRIGFFVAYPDAYDGDRWNDGRGTLDSSLIGVDDVKFITAMVTDIAARMSVESTRVYVTGASNGAIMAYRLGCETSGVFAGIAPVIGNVAEPIADSCAPQAPISILSINGDSDPFIPFEGGEVCKDVKRGCEKGYVISTEDSLAIFARVDGCSMLPESEMLAPSVIDGTMIEKRTYRDCMSGTIVVLYIVHGGGHTWPPRKPQLPSAGAPTGNLDATRVIVETLLGG